MALGRGGDDGARAPADTLQTEAQSSALLRQALLEALQKLDEGQPALAAAEHVLSAYGGANLRPGVSARSAADAGNELRRRNEQLSLLSSIARLLSSVETPEQLFDVLLTQLLGPLDLVNLEFYFVDAADGRLHRRLHRASDPALDPGPDVLEPGQGVVGRCMRTHHAQVVNDTRLDPDFFDPVPGSVRSQAAFPLFVSSRLIGVMNLECGQVDQFSPDRVEMLAALAPQAAVVVERLRLMGGLQERERMLAHALDSFPGMYYRCRNDRDRTLEVVSEQCLDLTGYSREEFLSGKVSFGSDVIAEEDRGRVWDEVQAALEERRHYVLEYGIVTKAGTPRYAWEQGGGVWGEDGSLLALEGVILDVTPQSQAMRDLAEAEQKYRRLFEAMDEGLVIVDHQQGSIFAEANPVAERLFGVAPGGLVGRHLLDFCDAAGEALLHEQLERRKRGEVSRYEMDLVREDGGRRRIQVTASPRFDATGAVTGTFSLLVDVTESRRREDALRSSEARLQALIDTTLDAIVVIDKEGTIETFNRTAEKLFGWSAEEALGQPVSILMSEAGAARHEEAMASYFSSGGHPVLCNRAEVQARRKDGTYLPVELAVSALEIGGQRKFLGMLRDISKRQEAFAALQGSEARYRRLAQELSVSQEKIEVLLGHSSDIITLLSAEGRILYQSGSILPILGYEPDELLDGDVFELIHPEDGEACREAIGRILAQPGASGIVQLRFRHKDGQWVDIESKGVNLLHVGGIEAVFVNSRDITAQRAAEKARASSEALARMVIDGSPLGITLRTAEGRLIHANPAWMGFWKVDAQALARQREPGDPEYAQHLREFFGAEQAEKILAVHREGGYHVVEACEFEHPNIGHHWITFRCYSIPGSDVREHQVVCITEDITERKQVEAAVLAQQEETAKIVQLLSAVIDHANEAIIVAAPDGRIETFNPAAEKIFGYRAEEVLGQSINLLMDMPDAASHDQYVERFESSRVPHVIGIGREVTGRRKGGGLIPLELAVNVMLVGGERKYLGMLEDITARKEAEARQREMEERLQQSQKLESLGLLAGGIAHDFNNLLVAILGNAGLALLDIEEDSEPRRRLESIETAARRAAELTNQMLAYSGRGRFVVEPVDLSALVGEMSSLLKTAISKEIRLELDPASGLPLVEADVTQLRQVVMNLITNAADAANRPGGVIRIRTGKMEVDAGWASACVGHPPLRDGPYVFLEVEDNGQGMDESTLARIFDPFFTTKFTGRGLGLSAVLGIVHGHHGAIHVASRPGEGTVFRIALPPVGQAAEVHAGPTLEKAAPDAGLPGRVLIVDDEETVLAVARAILTRRGVEVVVCDDAKEGLELFAAQPETYSCLLLDLTMPGMGGEELLARARALRPGIPAVVMSGYSESAIEQGEGGAGRVVFMQKPFTPAALTSAIEAAMRR